jgi:hypothetical protein
MQIFALLGRPTEQCGKLAAKSGMRLPATGCNAAGSPAVVRAVAGERMRGASPLVVDLAVRMMQVGARRGESTAG